MEREAPLLFATPLKPNGECETPDVLLAYLAPLAHEETEAGPTPKRNRSEETEAGPTPKSKRSLCLSILDTPEAKVPETPVQTPNTNETPETAHRRHCNRSKYKYTPPVHCPLAAAAAFIEAAAGLIIMESVEKPTDPPPTEDDLYDLSQGPTEADHTPRGSATRRRCQTVPRRRLRLEENVDIFLKHRCFIRRLEDLQGPLEAVTLGVYLKCSDEMKQELTNRLGTHEKQDRVPSSLPPSVVKGPV